MCLADFHIEDDDYDYNDNDDDDDERNTTFERINRIDCNVITVRWWKNQEFDQKYKHPMLEQS